MQAHWFDLVYSTCRHLIVGVLALIALSASAEEAESHYHVIVHPDSRIESLSTAQLRRIFSGRQTNWPDGAPVAVFVYKNEHPLHVGFSKQVLFMFPYQLERIWDTKTYSGQGERPEIVDSEADMLERVKRHPGSIGYILSLPDASNVKTLTIEERT